MNTNTTTYAAQWYCPHCKQYIPFGVSHSGTDVYSILVPKTYKDGWLDAADYIEQNTNIWAKTRQRIAAELRKMAEAK